MVWDDCYYILFYRQNNRVGKFKITTGKEAACAPVGEKAQLAEQFLRRPEEMHLELDTASVSHGLFHCHRLSDLPLTD